MNSNPEIIKILQDFHQTQLLLTPTQKITWSVRNLNSLPKNDDCTLDSPNFVFQNASWCLRLYPHCRADEGKAFIGIKIIRLSSCVPRHRLRYHLKSLYSQNNVFVPVAEFDEFHAERSHMTFLERYLSINDAARDVFGVEFQVSCYGSYVDAFSQTEFVTQEKKDVKILCENFKNLLLNGEDHDVVLKVMDKEFRAHKNILRARSEVFESMLSHDMIEKSSGVIDIPDCDPSAFEHFLTYLYSGDVDALDVGNMLSLYYIADKYDMEHLKDECRDFIKKSLTPTAVSEAIQIALNHSDADLLDNAANYFAKHVNEVLRTVEWQFFVKHNPIQANELFIKATENMTALIKMGQMSM